MSSPKPLPKVPEPKTYKVNNVSCTEQEFKRYHAEMKALAVMEHRLWKVCREGMRPFKRY